jgi:hypothetical protein
LGLLLCWLTNKSSSFCSLSAAVRSDVILSAFVVNFNFSFSNGLRFRAGHYKIPAQQQALDAVPFQKTGERNFKKEGIISDSLNFNDE